MSRYEPTLISIHFTLNKPVAKPAGTLVDKSEGNYATGCAASRHIGVQVVSVLDEDDTAAGVIAKGLAQLGQARRILQDLEIEEPTTLMAGPIAGTVIHLINIMAKVHDDHKPRRVQAHHVFATRTGVASYINIRNLIMARYKYSLTYDDRKPGTAVDHIFTACIYLGMAILVTPGPYSEHLAIGLAYLVRQTANQSWPCFPEDNYEDALETISYFVPDITVGRTGKGIGFSPETWVWDGLYDRSGGQDARDSLCTIEVSLSMPSQRLSSLLLQA
ncbi:hypothetical protein QBC37DRAFT_387805 [Rhypophila decipiens]|uniref:Uncharacterized protein n=1 Tax=Rhypophila decipiens TaxID=261697 RepID=A0AAN6YCT7_9PEZI|nr:hypothetical protein QBC37DRAFT_387805 [Rhypophila decipiens]